MSRKSLSIVDVTHDLLLTMPPPMPSGDTDKEGRGRVVVVGGSTRAPGGPMLSGLAALRAGAGKVQLAVPRSLGTAVGVAFPEVGIACFDETAQGEPAPTACENVCGIVEIADAVLIGPGLMDERAAQALTLGLLDRTTTPAFILDAMALTGLIDERDAILRHKGRVILTPHAGEMAALTGRSKESIQADPAPVALEIAERLGCAVVMKGATTFVVTPDGQVFSHSGGVVGLATSGSGDVLAGAISALVSRGASILQACLWGVYVHAQAGERLSREFGSLGLIAREIADEIPRVFKDSLD
jgi:hydroxyethylthiazole kinase-like uncharacterized protein yjeF